MARAVDRPNDRQHSYDRHPLNWKRLELEKKRTERRRKGQNPLILLDEPPEEKHIPAGRKLGQLACERNEAEQQLHQHTRPRDTLVMARNWAETVTDPVMRGLIGGTRP